MSLQILQGGIQPWAPVGGGKSRRSIAPPPPKNQENFVPVIWGNFCFILHVGAFLLRFSHYSFALAGGGVIVGNCPLKKIRYLLRLFAAFSLCGGLFATFFSL